MKHIKLLSIILALVFILLSFVSCSSDSAMGSIDGNYADKNFASDSNLGDVYYNGDYEYTEESNNLQNGDTQNVSGKIIYTAYLTAQTKTFDETTTKIKNLIAENGGYIASSELSGGTNYDYDSYDSRRATFIIKVPAENFNKLIESAQGIANIINKSVNSEDVTMQYLDYEVRLNNLKNQEQRLNELLLKAENLDQMLRIESEITQVRTDIERITQSFEVLKNKIAYSTITLNLREVTEYTPVQEKETFFARIRNAFIESWKGFSDNIQDFVVWFVASIPTFIVLAGITILIIGFIKIANRKRKVKTIPYTKKETQVDINKDNKTENK